MRDEYLAKYPQWLKEDKDDELVVFDQMVCLWAGRYTGNLKQKTGSQPLPVRAGSSTSETEELHCKLATMELPNIS